MVYIMDRGYNYYDPEKKKIISVRNRSEVPGWICVVKGGMGNTYTFYPAKSSSTHTPDEITLNGSFLLSALKSEQMAKAGSRNGSVTAEASDSDDTFVVTISDGYRPNKSDLEVINAAFIEWINPKTDDTKKDDAKADGKDDTGKPAGDTTGKDDTGKPAGDTTGKDDTGKPTGSTAGKDGTGKPTGSTPAKPTTGTPAKPTTGTPARPLPTRKPTPPQANQPKFISGAEAFAMLRAGKSSTEILAMTTKPIEKIPIFIGSSDDDDKKT